MNEISKVLNKDEKLLWEGRPLFWPYFFSGRASSIFSLLILLPLIAVVPSLLNSYKLLSSVNAAHGTGYMLLMPMIMLGIIPLMFLWTFFYKILAYKYIWYAITDKRVIIQKGLIGRDFDMVDFDKITNAEVNVGLADKIFGGGNTGSIYFSTAGSFAYARRGGMVVARPYIIASVYEPYKLFNFFKKVSYDVKTDIQYPNKLRPEENPGYNTTYSPNE